MGFEERKVPVLKTPQKKVIPFWNMFMWSRCFGKSRANSVWSLCNLKIEAIRRHAQAWECLICKDPPPHHFLCNARLTYIILEKVAASFEVNSHQLLHEPKQIHESSLREEYKLHPHNPKQKNQQIYQPKPTEDHKCSCGTPLAPSLLEAVRRAFVAYVLIAAGVAFKITRGVF